MNLYELSQEVNEAIEKYLLCFDENGVQIVTDEEASDLLIALEQLENKKNDVIEWMLQKRQNSEARIVGVSEEIKRLQSIVAREEKTIESMEKLVRYYIPEAEKPVTISNWTVSYRRSKQTIIDNEELIPSQFKKEKTTISIDKTEIKKAIESGEEVSGAHIQENSNLQIK